MSSASAHTRLEPFLDLQTKLADAQARRDATHPRLDHPLQRGHAPAPPPATPQELTVASPNSIEAAIAVRYDTTADRALADVALNPDPLRRLSICILVMKNGFTLVGTYALALNESFDPELGRTRAYEHAISQLGALMDFATRETIPVPIRT